MSNYHAFQPQQDPENNLVDLTYEKLSLFAKSDNFWNLFDTSFGTEYDRKSASGESILDLL